MKKGEGSEGWVIKKKKKDRNTLFPTVNKKPQSLQLARLRGFKISDLRHLKTNQPSRVAQPPKKKKITNIELKLMVKNQTPRGFFFFLTFKLIKLIYTVVIIKN